jgi:hypothetical protein
VPGKLMDAGHCVDASFAWKLTDKKPQRAQRRPRKACGVRRQE